MPNLQEYLSDDRNIAGFFNPDTGDMSFSATHSSINGPRSEEWGNQIEEVIRGCEAQLAQLQSQRDNILKEEMGEQRKKKWIIDPANPEQTVLKGKSGETMVADATESVSDSVATIDAQIAKIQGQIDKLQNSLTKTKTGASAKALAGGQFVLSRQSDGWHLMTKFPEKLQTPVSQQFMQELLSLTGGLIVNVPHAIHIYDPVSSGDIKTFTDGILQSKKSFLNSMGTWLRKSQSIMGVHWT